MYAAICLIVFQPPAIGARDTYACRMDAIQTVCDRVGPDMFWYVVVCLYLVCGYMSDHTVRIRTGVSTPGHQGHGLVCFCMTWYDLVCSCMSVSCMRLDCLIIRFVYVLGCQPPAIRARDTYAYRMDAIETVCDRVCFCMTVSCMHLYV